MGQYETDRIRHKNNKYITKETNFIIDSLLTKKCDLISILDKEIEFADNETRLDILIKAKDIYKHKGKTMKKIENRFGPYRRPTTSTIPKYEALQKKTLELAILIEQNCPSCEEKSSALTLLQQAKMLANAAIAIYNEENND